jgi:hypothetical protein
MLFGEAVAVYCENHTEGRLRNFSMLKQVVLLVTTGLEMVMWALKITYPDVNWIEFAHDILRFLRTMWWTFGFRKILRSAVF